VLRVKNANQYCLEILVLDNGHKNPNFYTNITGNIVAADCICPWVISPTEHVMRCRHWLVMHKLRWILKEKRTKKEK